MKRLDEYVKRWHVIVGVVAALAAVGLDVSELRPAWSFEHRALAADFYSAECARLKREWYLAMELKDKYGRDSIAAPAWLIDKLVDLEKEMSRLNCDA